MLREPPNAETLLTCINLLTLLAKQQAADSEKRKSMVSSGDRSAKIRTYNYPQGRVTDHRIGLTSHKLDLIMDGDLESTITAIRTYFQAQQLKESPLAS